MNQLAVPSKVSARVAWVCSVHTSTQGATVHKGSASNLWHVRKYLGTSKTLHKSVSGPMFTCMIRSARHHALTRLQTNHNPEAHI